MQKDELKCRVEMGLFAAFAKAGEGLYARTVVMPTHVHLSPADKQTLFGSGSIGTLDVCGPKNTLKQVVTASGKYEKTLVNISFTEALQIGIKGLRVFNGDFGKCAKCILRGPQGEVVLEHGAAASARSLYISREYATIYRLSDGQKLCAAVNSGERKMIFEEVLVRISEKECVELHLDSDEATAAGLTDGQSIEILMPD
ncbi:MAG: PduL/EutD family phosphate acyltransferase [Oscillospiraceae bacterium]|nr:PduL/EutD family phosphate acyltransferase [Oscillospiraceae bacterium]MCL2277803.1 PduL/EutD family phosphate acyltransferase [Oscillospiraceae bacterium]